MILLKVSRILLFYLCAPKFKTVVLSDAVSNHGVINRGLKGQTEPGSSPTSYGDCEHVKHSEPLLYPSLKRDNNILESTLLSAFLWTEDTQSPTIPTLMPRLHRYEETEACELKLFVEDPQLLHGRAHILAQVLDSCCHAFTTTLHPRAKPWVWVTLNLVENLGVGDLEFSGEFRSTKAGKVPQEILFQLTVLTFPSYPISL